MKLFNSFLVALTVFVFIFPVNAQRRKRATQPQPTQTEQTTPSGNGRRVKREAANTPRVRCTIPLPNSPGLRGLQLDLGFGQFDVNFFGDLYFDVNPTSPSYRPSYNFLHSYVLYARETRRKSVTESLTPEQEKALKDFSRMRNPQREKQIVEEQARREEEERNAPKKVVIEPKDLIKKMIAQFYGREDPRIWNFQILYRDELAFENVEEIEQNFAENLKIPVGSWVPIPDPDYNMKVLSSLVGLLDFRFTPPENIILRQAECNGWRAVFVTSSNTTGLALSITNSFVSDNMEQLIARDQKAINEDQKQRTKKIFTP
jgi:hypothetical protein